MCNIYCSRHICAISIAAGTDGSGHQHPTSGVQLQELQTHVDILLD
jgi:hypothetical protein